MKNRSFFGRFASCLATRHTAVTGARVVVLALGLGASAIAPTVLAAGNAEAGRNKISMCIGCHQIPGYKASFPRVYSVPKIGGQTAQYLENALLAYKKGDRSHPTMRGIAGSLSDQDIADLAAYYAGSPKK